MDNHIGNYFLTLYPAGHFVPENVLLFPLLTQTIFFIAGFFTTGATEPVTTID